MHLNDERANTQDIQTRKQASRPEGAICEVNEVTGWNLPQSQSPTTPSMEDNIYTPHPSFSNVLLPLVLYLSLSISIILQIFYPTNQARKKENINDGSF